MGVCKCVGESGSIETDSIHDFNSIQFQSLHVKVSEIIALTLQHIINSGVFSLFVSV